MSNITDYAGAKGRVTLSGLGQLSGHYRLQPKLDGAYCEVHLDAQGRVYRALTRTGRDFGQLASHLMGSFWGWPHAVISGELMAHTEAGNRDAQRLGYRRFIAFDCIRAGGGEYVARHPYRWRRELLLRMQSEVINLGPGKEWGDDRHGRAHSRSDGRYCRRVPTDWRLMEIVPQEPLERLGACWSDWVEKVGGEGLVAVHQAAPLGRRRAKLKCKVHHDFTCVVVGQDARRLQLHWPEASMTLVVGQRQGVTVAPGDRVDVRADGFTDGGRPKSPRLVRARPDLS